MRKEGGRLVLVLISNGERLDILDIGGGFPRKNGGRYRDD